MLHPIDSDPIDAVITWVDGNAPAHRALRAEYMGDTAERLHENAINPHRWEGSDEIYFCLQSMNNFAPWLRKIWIVVDSDAPDLSKLPSDLRTKIEIVHHKQLFDEFANFLPTFNSLSIETLLWRIEGLSERFLYFNDDIFLTAPLIPTDVFVDQLPVLRGEWTDYTSLVDNTKLREDPALFSHYVEINAAQIAGYSAAYMFATAHMVHPMKRTVMQHLFDENQDMFAANVAHRFRDLSQFLPQGLHNHACLSADDAIIHGSLDHLHINSGQGMDEPPQTMRALLSSVAGSDVKFLCVNDLPQLEKLLPDARSILTKLVGGFS